LIERYTRPAMGRIWTEEKKYRCWLEVESAASTVLAEDGVIPARPRPLPQRQAARLPASRRSSEVKHDVIAFTTAVPRA